MLLAGLVDLRAAGTAGWVHADAKKDEGRGVMRQCFPDSFSGYQIVSAKTFPENGAGVSGRMLLVYVQANTGSTKS